MIWRRAAVWLVCLGPFFFASYGFANWFASTRPNVGAIAFEWEHGIPFWPWTIVPYWSLDLFYAISLFVCTTRREVDRQGQRLLLTQLISVACFLLFPLRFSFDRPQSDGVFGALFNALTSFDKPFNQAPSLHISLLVVVWSRLAHHIASRAGRIVLHAWMTLIGASILTTYQHHFIDLPTGLAVGFFVLWALPIEGPSPLAQLRFTTDRKRRRLAFFYCAGAFLCTALSFFGGSWLWLLWPALSLACVALIYAAIGERGFQKGANGRLSTGARGLLAPYLAGAWLNSRLWTRKHPDASEVLDGVSIGRIPTARELSRFNAIVDLSAEVSCGDYAARGYRSIPVLDLTQPSDEHLRDAADAIESARTRGPVLVCCALGYSRSAAAVVAWLLHTQRAHSFEEAVAIVRKARPRIVL
jgi:protein-tyrosine phosphatase